MNKKIQDPFELASRVCKASKEIMSIYDDVLTINKTDGFTRAEVLALAASCDLVGEICFSLSVYVETLVDSSWDVNGLGNGADTK